MAGIYVHIPFCRRKCLYCDFYSVGASLADWPRFVDGIIDEAEERIAPAVAAGLQFDTIYIGGGTPSLMPADEFSRLSEALLRYTSDLREFNIEVNPDDVTAQMSKVWREAGVNRVSMGVQSLIDAELRAVGRRHNAEAALKAFATLRTDFDNISLDLMFGLPGQTVESLAVTLDGFLEMRPEHISAYSLMYEERTALTRLRDQGKVEETPEEDSEAMFQMITGKLAAAGYEQYELSNYALSGRRSVHNSNYWHGVPYIGLGPAAHSYDGQRTRTANLPDYKKRRVETEVLTDDELREEYLLTRLRTREGIDLADFAARFGDTATRRLLQAAAPQLAAGHLEQTSTHLHLTSTAIMISDQIITAL